MNNELSPISEIIEEARAGRMFILVDDENRENEGDLVIPAEKADADAINFMARYGRGLICLALDSKRVDELGIPLMARHNGTRHQTAFTVSIEAREGVSTGISAHDRAQTIKTAIDPKKSRYDIVSPGHVFPLVSRDGGVLVRAGHTEAAVDIARLSGFNPSGVICEIMSEDGSMARLPELLKFAREHKIKIATIADLIEYRRKNEKLVQRITESEIETDYSGNWKLYLYQSKLEYAEHIALVKGNISPSEDETVLVRMHQLDVISDVFMARQSPKSKTLQKSMEIINKAGKGVVVLLRSPDKQSLSRSVELMQKKTPQSGKADPSTTIRDYGIGAQILLDLGIHKMNLLTNSGKSVIALDGYGLSIEDYTEIK